MIFRRLKKLASWVVTGVKRSAFLRDVQLGHLTGILLQRNETERGLEPLTNAFRVHPIYQLIYSVIQFLRSPVWIRTTSPRTRIGSATISISGDQCRAQESNLATPSRRIAPEPAHVGLHGMWLPGHGGLPSEQGHSGAQSTSVGMWLDDNSGQLVVKIGLEVENQTKTSGRGGRGYFGQGGLIGNRHQHDEVRDLHPTACNERMGFTEFKGRMSALRCG